MAVSLCMYMVPSPFAPRGAVLSRERGPTGVTFSPSLVMTSSWTIGVGSTGRRSAVGSEPLSSVSDLHFSPTPHIRACRGCWRIMRLYSLEWCQYSGNQGHEATENSHVLAALTTLRDRDILVRVVHALDPLVVVGSGLLLGFTTGTLIVAGRNRRRRLT